MDDWKDVRAYGAGWDVGANRGALLVRLHDEDTSVRIDVDSAAELAALLDLLRHARPVKFSREANAFRTGWQVVE